ncbi:hypothetical protein NC651_026292 [Populus alba x Populus x berolinensis]|nr:hypothetical protein NC651_026292 [Populus alba x Populus x berolinensis]
MNYTRNSAFENSLEIVLKRLPSITSLTGFNYTFFGEASAKVYGQALCRGDVNSSACRTCVEKASRQIFNDCISRGEAIIWYELCQVHYSFQNMTSLSVYAGKYLDRDSKEKSVSDQCTRDIRPHECLKCLKSAITDLEGCCSSRKGGMVLSRNCNVRFELYQFYNVSKHLSSPTSRGRKWKAGKVACVVFIPITVLAIVIGSCIVFLRHKRRKETDVERSHLALLQELANPRGVTITEEGQFAWRLWNEGREMEFADPLLMGRSPEIEIVTFMHIGLLCVQEDPANRPTMSFVVLALGSEPIALPLPKKPAFSLG